MARSRAEWKRDSTIPTSASQNCWKHCLTNGCGAAYPHRLEHTMGKVLFGLSVSLDGFIADKNDGVSEVFAWMGSAMEHFFEVAGEQLNETGVVIMGHRSFDQIYGEQGWVMPDGTPIPGPVIVLQSQAREPVKKGQTQFYFVTDGIESA